MSEFIKAQQETRANLTEQIRDVIEGAEKEGRGLDAAELEKIDRIEADIARADNAIAVAKRNEERALEASVAAKGFALPETSERNASDVLRQIAATRSAHTFTKEERTLVPSTNTVPKSFFDEVFDVARLVGPMLDVGQRINTTSGEDITIPTLTAYSTATLKAAGSAIDESEPTYSSITLGAYKYGLLIPVANELITDAGFNISAHLAEQAGNGLGFAVNAALTTGDGTNKPNGVVTAAGSGITGGTGVAGAFTADNLIDLQYSLDGAARRLPGVAYMAAGPAIGAMRKLKDTAGNYLYQVNVGQPDNFAGYPVVENPAIAAVATGAKSVLFGHWPSYKVRVAGGVQVATSTDYAFNTDTTVFRVMMRVDGDLTHASHIKYFIGAAS
jgi:HK97 family phage major capsid protein